jgi:hypothetical protein
VNVCSIFFLTNRLLYIIILPLSIFRFTFISSGYSKYLYSQLPKVSRHLILHIIYIFTCVLSFFYNNYILKHPRSVPFELPPLRSHDFRASISQDAYLKKKVCHEKLMLCDDTLTRYNLTIYTVWSFLPFSKDKINLARVLAAVESNKI